jgi:hypothetical protein
MLHPSPINSAGALTTFQPAFKFEEAGNGGRKRRPGTGLVVITYYPGLVRIQGIMRIIRHARLVTIMILSFCYIKTATEVFHDSRPITSLVRVSSVHRMISQYYRPKLKICSGI